MESAANAVNARFDFAFALRKGRGCSDNSITSVDTDC
jgi:hypothetical protein